MNTPSLRVIVSFLELPSLLLAMWSFKVIGSSPSSPTGTEQFSGSSLLAHKENTILDSSVCPLGKFGALVIFIWSLLLVGLMFKLEREKFYLLGWINMAIISIIFILSLAMNQPLFLRTLPYYFVQIAICILLIESSKTQC